LQSAYISEEGLTHVADHAGVRGADQGSERALARVARCLRLAKWARDRPVDEPDIFSGL